MARRGRASIALKQWGYRLVDRLVDGSRNCPPELAHSSELYILGKLVELAKPSTEALVGKLVAPPGTPAVQRRKIGRIFLEGLREKSVTDHDYPAELVREVLREISACWSTLVPLGELSDAFHHHCRGHEVPLFAPVKFRARPPEDAYSKCILQAEILASLRFREVRYGKGGLTRARNEVGKLAGFHPDAIRDWEPTVRRVLPSELDQLLTGAERLAHQVNRANGRKAQGLIRETEEMYGDESIVESKHELHKLLKAAKDRRTH